jgi:class 3 adenylate cyclase
VRVVDFAIALQKFARSKVLKNDRRLILKFGINQGPIVSGVIGEYNQQYSLFGKTLNLAKEACLKSTSGKILVTTNAKETLTRYSNNLAMKKTSIKIG